MYRANNASNPSREYDRILKVALAVGLVLVNFSTSSLSARECESPNLAPGLNSRIARLRFHTGRIVDKRPEISPILPEITGLPSPWIVYQWSQASVLSADKYIRNDPQTRDVRLGLAKLAFTTPDHHSHVWIYEEGSQARPIYELYERGGTLTSIGGSNLFLGRDFRLGGISLNKPLTYSLNAKLSKARISASVLAQQDGVVAAQVFSGFIISFQEANKQEKSTLFLQLPISDSRTQVREYRSCETRGNSHVIIFNGITQDRNRLQFVDDEGPLRPLTFNLYDYLKQFTASSTQCLDKKAGSRESISFNMEDMRNGHIGSIYIGLETENLDRRVVPEMDVEQGDIEVAMQLAGVSLKESRLEAVP